MAENKACRRAPTTVTASVFVILAACSSGGGGTAGTTGVGTSGGGTTGGTAGSTYSGSVILSNGVVGGVSRFSALAVFEAYNNAVCPGGTQLGNCCYEPPPSGTTGSIPTLVSAGNITVADNGAILGTMTFSSTPIPGYGALSSISMPTFMWVSGDSLTVTAAGATVDAFSGTVKAPGLISGVSPALSSTVTIPLASNWSVSWTPDTQSGETMYVNLLDDNLHSAITCTAQDSAGTVSFPSTLLSHFTSTDSGRVALSRHAGAAPGDANTSVGILAGVDLHGPATFQ